MAASGRNRWDAHTFRQTWQRLKTTHRADFTRSADAIARWHQREALAYTNSYALFPHDAVDLDPSSLYAAAWHVDRLLPRLPQPQRNWLIFRAGIRETLGQPDAALGDYGAALELAPRDSRLLEQRAAIWIQKGEYARAKEDLQRALAILFDEHQAAKAEQGDGFQYFAHDVLRSSTLHEDLPRLCLVQDDPAGYGKPASSCWSCPGRTRRANSSAPSPGPACWRRKASSNRSGS